MADWKKAYFPKSPILKIFSRKFHGLVLWLVGLNDAKPIDLAQSIWRWGCLKKALKQAKNVFFVFLGPFRAYVGQPQGHIGWAISMGFASFNPTNPRTNPWNFHEKFLRIGNFENQPFWIFFAWSPWKSVTNYVIEWMGLNFDVFPSFQEIPCYA